LAKKQKQATPEQVPTKRQLSKWQRQMRIRRIVIITAVVFLAALVSWVGYGYYKGYKSNPLRQVVIEVNGVHFTMEYFVNTLAAYANVWGMNSTTFNVYGSYLADMVATDIIDGELANQGAKSLGITVTTAEIDAALQQYGLPNDSTHQDIVRASLVQEKVKAYLSANLPATMEQADVEVMLVESEEVANEVITIVEAGGNSTNLTTLADGFSCNSSIEGDLGWLPQELMPNTLIANAAFNLSPDSISQPIYDATAIKDVGYWLIKVTGKQGDSINASVMLLDSEVEAEQIKAQLAAGGNFSTLAGNYSQYASNTTGGELVGLTPGSIGSMAFDLIAFTTTLDTVSEPVRDTSVHTTGGYWLVNVVDRGDHQLSDSVKQQLTNNDYNVWLRNLSNEGTINTYLDTDQKSYALNQVLAGL
jgi:parvulin-like peptidyl-prolyl isomerase